MLSIPEQDFRILRVKHVLDLYMRARFFAILMAAFVGAFALFATPAEAGGRHYRHYYGGYYRGGYGYYRPYYRSYGYYRPYYGGYGYYRPYYGGYGPTFYLAIPPVQIAIGGGGYW
jgi:hypothetical protein